MTGHHWKTHGNADIAVPDVEIGAADRSGPDLDFNITRSRRRFGHFAQFHMAGAGRKFH